MADQNPADYPIGTNAFPAFERDVENLDTAIVDRGSEKFPDRKGVQRYTYNGIEKRADRLLTGQAQQFDSFIASSTDHFQRFLESSGYSGGDRQYEAGIVLNSHNEGFVRCEPDETACLFYTPRGDTPLPYTTTGDWGPESDLFVVRGDDSLRQDLATSSKGGALVALPEVGMVSDALTYFTPEMVGAVGDFVADDSDAIEAILAIAKGRDIRLGSGKKYKISRPIQYFGDVSFVGEGIGSTIASDSQDFNLFKASGSFSFTRLLSSSVEINSHYWTIDDTSGISKGMLMEVVSSKSWYYDPRPASSDARKSELHIVAAIIGNKVITQRCANDGYELSDEIVSVSFYDPVKVRLENTFFEMEHELGKAKIGVEIAYSTYPKIKDCDFLNGSAVGLNLVGCYGTRVFNGIAKGTNGAGAAYAIKTVGCTDTVIDGTRFYENYAAVDVSGFKVISLDTVVRNTAVYGGGFNNNGEQMGWGENGELGAFQRGHGSHGPSDNTVFENNYLSKLHEAFPCRGRNIRISNNILAGRYRNAPIRLYHGENAEVINNICDPSFFGGKSTATAGGNINSRLADNFIDVFETFQSSADSKLVVSGNKVLVSGHFMRLYNGASQVAVIASNTIRFRPASGSQDSYVVSSATGQESSLLPGSSIAFDVLPSKTGSGATKLFDENINFSGIEVHGWSESFQPTLLGSVRWDNPVLGAIRVTLSGKYAEASVSIFGGTVSASAGQDYSVTINLPYKSTWPVSASSVEGAANRYGEAGSVSGNFSLKGAVIGLRRETNPGTTSVRAIFRYEIG